MADFSGRCPVPLLLTLLWVGVGTLKKKKNQCNMSGVGFQGPVTRLGEVPNNSQERNLTPRRIRPGSSAPVAESQLRAGPVA